MAAPISTPIPRIDEIEGIRGILSLIVVIGHINQAWMPWFWGCMEVFFAISGFLIGRIAIQNRNASNFWSAYLLRRVRRIWPLYYTVLAFVIAVVLFDGIIGTVTPSNGGTPASINLWAIKALVFLQNTQHYLTLGQLTPTIWEAGKPEMFEHAWSVAIEEQFYLIVPFAAWGILYLSKAIRIRPSGLVIAILVFLAFCISLRVAGVFWLILPGRLDAFALGIVLAVVKGRVDTGLLDRAVVRKAVSSLFFVAFALALALVLSYYFPARQPTPSDHTPFEWRSTMGLSIFALFGVSLVAICVFQCVPRVLTVLRSTVLQYFGRISYSTYLWHGAIMVILNNSSVFRSIVPHGFHVIATLAIIFLVSHFSFLYIELPWMRVKPAFRRPPAVAPSPVS